MNICLWVLQGITAFMYAASGIMKVFMFDKIREGVRSFDGLPRNVWKTLGVVELLCTVGLLVPDILHWHPALTVVAAGVLAVESIVFVAVHVKYRETTALAMSAVLGLVMVFIAYGRGILAPIF